MKRFGTSVFCNRPFSAVSVLTLQSDLHWCRNNSCSSCLCTPISTWKEKHLLLSSAQWDLHYAAKRAKPCATLKAKVKSLSVHTCSTAPVWTGVFLEVQHTHTLKHTHSGDFVSLLARPGIPVQHVSTLTRTVWPLCVWLQHCADTCMQPVVTLDCIHYREMVVDDHSA